ASMPADMACCPDGQKSKDCQDCPLMAMCVLKTTQAGPSAAEALPLRHAVRTVHSVLNDAPADELDRPPPDQPPRNLTGVSAPVASVRLERTDDACRSAAGPGSSRK